MSRRVVATTGGLVALVVAVAGVFWFLRDSPSSSTEPGTGLSSSSPSSSFSSSSASASSSSPSSPAATVGGAATEQPRVELPDGQHFAYLKGFDVPARTVVVDEVEFLGGEEAAAAAREDGEAEESCLDEQGLPGVCNDYYVRNVDEQTVTVTVDPDATITSNVLAIDISGDPGIDVHVSLEQLAGLFDDDPRAESARPFDVAVSDGTITSLREVFLP